jgi:diguanylate cyclase (GGDEF)-like protein
MPMGSNRLRFSNCLRNRQAGVGSESNPSDVALLNMSVDPQSLFRRRTLGSSTSKENCAVDDVFGGLLSDANRDLANLLRDVRTESHGTVHGAARSQQVSELLMRAVRCAAKQYMLQAELGNLAITDELTGLYNRRGFMALAERQLKLARRSGRGLLLFMMDVDRLKQINDSFGHSEGDCALKRTAGILEDTFRDSDVVARLGGDEFAVLAIEATGHSEATIKARLFECLHSVNAQRSRYEISITLGLARFDPASRASIGDLMAKADQAMYEQKRLQPKLLFEEASTPSPSAI